MFASAATSLLGCPACGRRPSWCWQRARRNGVMASAHADGRPARVTTNRRGATVLVPPTARGGSAGAGLPGRPGPAHPIMRASVSPGWSSSSSTYAAGRWQWAERLARRRRLGFSAVKMQGARGRGMGISLTLQGELILNDKREAGPGQGRGRTAVDRNGRDRRMQNARTGPAALQVQANCDTRAAMADGHACISSVGSS